MKNAAYFPVLHDRARYFGATWIFLLGFLWFGLMFGGNNYYNRQFSLIWLVVLTISVGVSGFVRANSLAQAARVLTSGLIPHAMWTIWFYKVFQQSAVRFVVAIVFGVILLQMRAYVWAWSVIPALISISLFVAVVSTFVANKMLHKAWLLVPITTFVAIIFSSTNGHTEAWLNAHFLWHIPFWFATPLFSLYLIKQWKNPPNVKSELWKWNLVWLQSIRGYFNRYTVIQLNSNIIKKNYLIPQILFIMLWMLFWRKNNSALISFGDSFDGKHFAFLFVLSLMAIQIVVCKDLHWRFLLAPQGFKRGAIAWHIFKSSFTYTGIQILIAYFVFQLFTNNIENIMSQQFVQYSLSKSIILLEVACMLSLSIIILGTKNPQRTFNFYGIGVVTIMLIAIFIELVILKGKTSENLFTADIKYAVCLGLVLLINIHFANRLWTVQKLLCYLKK